MVVGGAPLTRVIEIGYVNMKPLQYHCALEVFMSGTVVRPPLGLRAVWTVRWTLPQILERLLHRLRENSGIDENHVSSRRSVL